MPASSPRTSGRKASMSTPRDSKVAMNDDFLHDMNDSYNNDDAESDDDSSDEFVTSSRRDSASRANSGRQTPQALQRAAAASNEVSSPSNDSDDDYEAVEDVSDSDESDADVDDNFILRSAEKDLIEEFQRTEKPRITKTMSKGLDGMKITGEKPRPRRLSTRSEDSRPDLDLNLDFTQDPFGGLPTNDRLYQELIEDAEGVFDNELASWRIPDVPANTLSREDSTTSTSNPKRVRFESTPSRTSSMSSDEDPRDAFPDLFSGLDDPFTRQAPLHDLSHLDASAFHDVESLYDYDDDDDLAVLDLDEESTSTGDEMSESESEDGDTTDEETPDEQMARLREIKRVRAATLTQHRSPATPASKRSTPSKSRRGSDHTTPKADKTPRSGTFRHDPTRAVVSVDPTGSGVKLVCPSQPPDKEKAYWERARRAITSRDGSPQSASWVRPTGPASATPQRPLTAKSTLGTMFDGNLDFLRNHDDAGIANHLLQYATNNSLHLSQPAQTVTSDAESDSESNVNMEDFLQISDSDSEMDDDPDQLDLLSPESSNFLASPSSRWEGSPRKSIGPITSGGLLDHFDQQRGLVSSFRNNQHLAKHVSSLASHPATRAQTAESNALQVGRRGAANTPMTPARKNRLSQDFDSTGAGVKKLAATASPLASRGMHRRGRGSSLSGISQTLGLEQFGEHFRQ